MKRINLLFAVAILMTAAVGALASDQTDAKKDKTTKSIAAEKTKPAQAKPACQEKKVLLTGSYIRQSFRKNERITDGINPVVVLDHDVIQRTGASDLKQLLVRQGVH
jgi:uncharacterized protein YdeI (BOF family)